MDSLSSDEKCPLSLSLSNYRYIRSSYRYIHIYRKAENFFLPFRYFDLIIAYTIIRLEKRRLGKKWSKTHEKPNTRRNDVWTAWLSEPRRELFSSRKTFLWPRNHGNTRFIVPSFSRALPTTDSHWSTCQACVDNECFLNFRSREESPNSLITGTRSEHIVGLSSTGESLTTGDCHP